MEMPLGVPPCDLSYLQFVPMWGGQNTPQVYWGAVICGVFARIDHHYYWAGVRQVFKSHVNVGLSHPYLSVHPSCHVYVGLSSPRVWR